MTLSVLYNDWHILHCKAACSLVLFMQVYSMDIITRECSH